MATAAGSAAFPAARARESPPASRPPPARLPPASRSPDPAGALSAGP
ncbi:hypothetical protein [Frankia sp. CpI1-P]|nr:hypothetical protein [Frankia sp. CpI1-P]